MNDPVKPFDRIRAAVKAGFVVRTRTDDSTTEARTNARSGFEKALASGAQYISTDDLMPRVEWSPYSVRLSGGAPARLSPAAK